MSLFRRLSIRYPLIIWGLVVIGMLASPSSSQAQTPAPPKVEKFALLVGITKYDPQKGLTPLEGCLNDVDAMKASLVHNFGFKNDNAHVLLLKNEAATRTGIINGFRSQLTANAKKYPNAVFLFYYSGHGSQTHDINGDEALLDPSDTLDETLVPFDSTRDPNDHQHFDLVDDDLQVLYDELQGVAHFKGLLTSIFDCCHSGTATRSGVPLGDSHRHIKGVTADSRLNPQDLFLIGKGLTADSRRYPDKQITPDLRFQPGGKASLVSRIDRYAAFSGSMADETSEERLFPEVVNRQQVERSHGALTYYLLQAMSGASQKTTNGEIWQGVSRALCRFSQSPQLEGVTNQPFLGGSIRSTTLPITYTREGNTLTIACGIEGGAIQGGFIELFGTAASAKAKGVTKSDSFSSPSSLGRLQITSAGVGHSKIVVPETFKAPLPAKGTAQLLTPYFGQQPLHVGLGDLSATPVARRLREFTQNNDFVQMASSDYMPDVTLVTCTYGEAFPLGRPLEEAPHPTGERGYFVSVRPGDPPLFRAWFKALPDGDISAEDNEELREALDNFAAQRNILALSNASASASKFVGAVSLEVFKVQGRMDGSNFVPTPNGTTRLLPDATGGFDVKDQDRIQYRLTNQTNDRVYISLLWLSQDGSITVVSDVNNRNDTSIVLKPKGEDGSTARTAVYRINPPFGGEALKLLVSSQPINAAVLERDKLKRDAEGKGSASPFEMLLGQALDTRTPISRKDSSNIRFDGWAVGDFRLAIGPKAKP